MKTTLELPDELTRRIKLRAAAPQITCSIVQALQA